MLICLEAGGGGRAEDRRGGCGRPPAGRATTSQRDVVRLSQGKVPGVLAVGGARAGRGGAGVVPNCRWVAVSSNQFQFEKIMRRRNQNAACLTGWAVSVGSERGLAGAARAERRALPTRVSSDRQLRLLPLILMNCGSFQSIPNNSNDFWGNYVEAKSKRGTFNGVGGLCWLRARVGRRKRCRRSRFATAVQNTLVAGGVALGRRHDVPGAGNGKLLEV